MLLLTLSLLCAPSALHAQNRETRIGIIGGGAAGLSAAHALTKAGFKSVTVLEKQPEVGGKTQTIQHDTNSYEMGAIMSGPSYQAVMKLAEAYGQKIVPFAPGSTALVEFDPASGKAKPLSIGRKLIYLAAAAEYHLLYYKYRQFFRSAGLQNAPPEMNEPFEKWIKKNARFHVALQELLSHSFVSFGYGYMSQVPAAYVFRYFSPHLLRSFLFGQVRMLENGYQELWKKVASELRVETTFEVAEAKRVDSVWTVRSTDGKQAQFDTLIWTGPLEEAASKVEMAEPLKDVFSKIKYQNYYSTLVEVDGLPKGNGVITKNYQAERQGEIVSWLHRWPEKSGLANFYSLSDGPLSPEDVEKRVNEFAQANRFQVKKIVKNVGWRYFPHFDQTALEERAYDLIESSQGKHGLFFAGELMNFSTVEHSVEYSQSLVEKFFVREARLSAPLPTHYTQMKGPEKTAYLWSQILATEYVKPPTYAEASTSGLKGALYFLPSRLVRAFSNNNDIIERGREKVIHKLGSTALFTFEPKDDGYRKFEGLIRLSNAVDASGGVIYPSFSMKVPLDQADRSINFSIGKSFDSQKLGNDQKSKPDFNFFRDDKLYPFSNELPMIPRSTIGKAFKWIFDRATLQPNYIPVDELTKVMNKAAPRRFVFRAPVEIQSLMTSETYMDERAVFARIPEGSILFHVYESTGLNDPGRYVGDVRTQSRFVNSSFGDQNLYFRHEARGVKNLPPEFSRAADDLRMQSCRPAFGS